MFLNIPSLLIHTLASHNLAYTCSSYHNALHGGKNKVEIKLTPFTSFPVWVIFISFYFLVPQKYIGAKNLPLALQGFVTKDKMMILDRKVIYIY